MPRRSAAGGLPVTRGKPPLRVTLDDPAVRKRLPTYLERRQADIQQIELALAAGAFDTVGAIAHGLKGSGGLYGLQPISDLGAELERAAKAGESEAARHALDSLKDYLDRLEY